VPPADSSPNGAARPSPAIVRWAALVPAGGPVLDVAAGGGRHTHLFLARGHPVTAVDRDTAALHAIVAARLEIVQADLEGAPWPFAGRTFAGVVVCNYFWRALLPVLVASVAPGGVLLYDSFALGNERFGRPRNPDFLARPDELRDAVQGELHVVEYWHGAVGSPPNSVRQLLAARRHDSADPAPPLEPPQHRHRDRGHQREAQRVAPPHLQLRHPVEVHAVDADEERQRDEDRGDDRQQLHHLVEPVVDRRQVQVEQARRSSRGSSRAGRAAARRGRARRAGTAAPRRRSACGSPRTSELVASRSGQTARRSSSRHRRTACSSGTPCWPRALASRISSSIFSSRSSCSSSTGK
jgi:SAM-dependent methyltransferase